MIRFCYDSVLGPFPAPDHEEFAPLGVGAGQRYLTPAQKLDAFVQKAKDVHRGFHVIAILFFQLRPLAVFSAAAVARHPAELGIRIAFVFVRVGLG